MSDNKHLIVNEQLHRRAKAAAALEGMTLKEWVSRLIEERAEEVLGETNARENDNSD